MERIQNNLLRDFFKNIGSALSKFINDGEVDDDVELEGDLKLDPIETLKSIQQKSAIQKNIPANSRTRTPRVQETNSRTSSRVTTPRTASRDDGR